MDARGKATTRVYGGSFDITLSQLPPFPIVEWALNSRKYMDGTIVVLDEENIPVSKVLFEHAACTCFDINYMQEGSGYVATKLLIQAEKIIVGDGIDFDNEWTETE
ncbi:MAG: type VI secretion system needle protein Hcp [Prevotella sp.]|nr:type VI secretion system needle protein Hcp [Prevotella sp.]